MTPAEFKALCSEFAQEPDLCIQACLQHAKPYFNILRWGAFYKEGLAAFVAHTLTLKRAQAAQGASALSLESDALHKTVGPLSVQQAESLLTRQVDNPFYRTHYGQTYLCLSRMVGAGAMAV